MWTTWKTGSSWRELLEEMKYLISETGKAICDGVEEKLSAGVMHICHKGSEHTIINTGDYDLVMLAVVISR